MKLNAATPALPPPPPFSVGVKTLGKSPEFHVKHLIKQAPKHAPPAGQGTGCTCSEAINTMNAACARCSAEFGMWVEHMEEEASVNLYAHAEMIWQGKA